MTFRRMILGSVAMIALLGSVVPSADAQWHHHHRHCFWRHHHRVCR